MTPDRFLFRVGSVAILAASIIAGCGQFTPVTLDTSAVQGRRDIGFAGCDEEKHYPIYDSGHEWAQVAGAAAVGAAGGPLAADAAIASSAVDQATLLDKEAAKLDFDAARFASDELRHDLIAAGYTVQTFEVSRKRTINGNVNFAADYAGAPSSVNLILDCAVTATYGNGRTSAYVPEVHLLLRLADPSSGSILMMRKYIYAGSDTSEALVSDSIVANKAFNYGTLSEIADHPGRAIHAFKDGIGILAKVGIATLE